MRLPAVLKLLRPKQWTKNLLVFAAWMFTASFNSWAATSKALLAFTVLCILSSATYALNDFIDVDSDRQHPLKKNRPLASGQLTPSTGLLISLALLLVGFGLAYAGGSYLQFGALLFVIVQLSYNFGGKKVAVFDVLLISGAFVVRAAVGAWVLNVSISEWLLFCTGSLALLIGFAKRRAEFIAVGPGASRESLKDYNQATLDALVILSANLAAISYSLYAIQSQTAINHPAIFLTAPVVLYGIMRYIYLIFSRQEGQEPENLVFGDPHMILVLILFTFLALAAMTGWRLSPF